MSKLIALNRNSALRRTRRVYYTGDTLHDLRQEFGIDDFDISNALSMSLCKLIYRFNGRCVIPFQFELELAVAILGEKMGPEMTDRRIKDGNSWRRISIDRHDHVECRYIERCGANIDQRMQTFGNLW